MWSRSAISPIVHITAVGAADLLSTGSVVIVNSVNREIGTRVLADPRGANYPRGVRGLGRTRSRGDYINRRPIHPRIALCRSVSPISMSALQQESSDTGS